jgi:hypothetical protein
VKLALILNKVTNNPRKLFSKINPFWNTKSFKMINNQALTFGTEILYLIQINHQPDATNFQYLILTYVYSSTCFGRFPAHHQELNDCSGSLWFYLRIAVIVVMCLWSGRPAGPTTNTARLSPRYEGKTRGCHCSHWAPDDGREDARNMLSYK